LQDPGVLIVNGSNFEVTPSSTISETNSSGQLTNIKFTYHATDGANSNSILSDHAKNLTFLDEEKPLITLAPEGENEDTVTNPENRFFLIEAGVDYLTDIRNSNFKLWNGTPNESASNALSGVDYQLNIKAEDFVDGTITDQIIRTFKYADTNASVNFWGGGRYATGNAKNQTYVMEYDVRDGDDSEDDSIRNWADTVRRYFVVKDTTPPVISSAKDGTTVSISATSTELDVNNISEVKDEIVSDLMDSISDVIDSSYNFEDFNVTIGKTPNPVVDDFDGRQYYPYNPGEQGYYVTITVKDDYGNISDPITRELKVGDNTPPVITLNGADVIHDFFRYGKIENNTTAVPNQLLFGDRASSPDLNPEYNSIGFAQGAHRLFLDQYNFTDPGAYAEDADSAGNQGYFSTEKGYPDFDGDGVGEGHVIEKTTDDIRENSIWETNSSTKAVGIIYSYGSLTQTTLANVQDLYEGLPSANDDENGTSLIPDMNGSGAQNLNVKVYTIYYRVKDYWGNLSETEFRKVYFYESRQYEDSAFYATPLVTATGDGNFSSVNSYGISDLSSNQVDYDGDGVSDFWELTLGYRPNDPSHTPDLTNHDLFKNLYSASGEQNMTIGN